MNPFAELAEVAAAFVVLYGVAVLADRLRRSPPPAAPATSTAVPAAPVPARNTVPYDDSGVIAFGREDPEGPQ